MLGLDLGLAQIEGRVFRLNQEKVLILQDRVNIRTKHKHVYPYSTHTKVLSFYDANIYLKTYLWFGRDLY